MNRNRYLFIGVGFIVLAVGFTVGLLCSVLPWKVSIFIPLGAIIITCELVRPKQGRPWDYLTLINVSFFITYILAPITFLTVPGKLRHYTDPIFEEVIASVTIVYITYFIFVAGYSMMGKIIKRSKPQIKNCKTVSMNGIAWFFLLIGVVSFVLYASLYGGIGELFRQSDRIRSGFVGDSGFVFLRHFISFITFAAWLFVAEFMFGPSKTRNVNRLILVASIFVLAIVSKLVMAGRSDIIMVIVPIILAPYYIQKRWPPLRIVLLGSIAFVTWILVGDPLFYWITYGIVPKLSLDMGSWYFRLINEFTHPFESLIVALREDQFALRGISDIILGIASLLPEKLLGITLPDTISSYNTLFLLGKFESVIPPGLIAYLFYAFSILGILVGGFIFGATLSLIENWFWRLEHLHNAFTYQYVAIGLSFAYYVMLGDPRVYLQAYLLIYVAAIIMIVWVLFRTKMSQLLLQSSIHVKVTSEYDLKG